MKVLFLVIEFAPVNTTGNFRSLKFVKYLHKFGIQPIVVTMDANELASRFDAKIDESLLSEVPEGTFIYRVGSGSHWKRPRTKLGNFLNIYFNLVDGIAREWEKNLMSQLDKIVEEQCPNAIYTSLPPFSMGVLTTKVAARYNLPLIIDMRDLWSHWGSDPNSSILHYYLKKRLERKAFNKAAKIIGVTPQLINIFKKAHPAINSRKFEVIPNGFDYELDELNISTDRLNPKEEFIIGYVGSFYYDPGVHTMSRLPWWKKRGHRMLQYSPVKENWLYRSPYFFFKALHQLFQQNAQLKKVIRFHLIGREPYWLKNMLQEFDLHDIYYCYGFVSHSESLKIQDNFDAFLATSEKVEGSEHYCLPSKLFDYLQKRKPILGFVTDGVQKDFLLNSGLGIICDPDDEKISAKLIGDLVMAEKAFRPDIEFLKEYSRLRLTKKLSDVFYSAISQ